MEATQSVVRPLFHSEVRCIRGPSVTAHVAARPDQEFYLVEPVVNYADRLKRVEEFSGPTGLSAGQFEDLAMSLFVKLRADEQLAPAFAGICLPLPFGSRKVSDYGTELVDVLVGVARAYTSEFPQRKFENYHGGNFVGRVMVLPNTRRDPFVARLSKSGVALYFPNLLQGFSVNAQRQMIEDLPESMLLCGALDTALAMAAYPDVLARDNGTPGYDCSTVSFHAVGTSLYFKADNVALTFAAKTDLDYGYDFHSGGLLFLG